MLEQMNRDQTVVVIGAAGFIGGAVYRELISQDFDVLGLDARRSPIHTEIRQVDILDLESLTEQIPAGASVIHLAGPVAGSFSRGMASPWRLQVDGTSNVLHAAASKGCPNIVFGSSYHVYMASPPESKVDENTDLPEKDLDAFGTSKLVSEHLARAFCRHAGMNLVTLRFGSVYGLGSCTNLMGDLFSACSSDEEVEIWGAGKRTNHYVDLYDLAKGCALALTAQPGTYNVLDPHRYTIRDVCEVAEQTLGVRTTYRMDIPERPSFATISADRFMDATGWKPTSLTESFRRILPQIVAQRAA